MTTSKRRAVIELCFPSIPLVSLQLYTFKESILWILPDPQTRALRQGVVFEIDHVFLGLYVDCFGFAYSNRGLDFGRI